MSVRRGSTVYTSARAHKNGCNYVKIETARNFLPVLKIHMAQAVENVSVHVTRVLFLVLAGKFRPDYGLLLELHALDFR